MHDGLPFVLAQVPFLFAGTTKVSIHGSMLWLHSAEGLQNLGLCLHTKHSLTCPMAL